MFPFKYKLKIAERVKAKREQHPRYYRRKTLAEVRLFLRSLWQIAASAISKYFAFKCYVR